MIGRLAGQFPTLIWPQSFSVSFPQIENGEVTEPPQLVGDVNNDGVVNIQDLVLVGANFGKTGENPAVVNGDGVVNIVDLVVKVAQCVWEPPPPHRLSTSPRRDGDTRLLQ